MDGQKGAWVQIQYSVLEPEQRSPFLPQETKMCPLLVWQKGFLTQEANVGDKVEIFTITGRKVSGRLVKINPVYEHNFGKPVLELLSTGIELRKYLEGDVK